MRSFGLKRDILLPRYISFLEKYAKGVGGQRTYLDYLRKAKLYFLEGYGLRELLDYKPPILRQWQDVFRGIFTEEKNRKDATVVQIGMLNDMIASINETSIKMSQDFLEKLPKAVVKYYKHKDGMHVDLICLGITVLISSFLMETGIDINRLYTAYSPEHVFLIIELADGSYYFIDTSKGHPEIVSGHISNLEKYSIRDAVEKEKSVIMELPEYFAKLYPGMSRISVARLEEGLKAALHSNQGVVFIDYANYEKDNSKKLSLLKEALEEFELAYGLNSKSLEICYNYGAAILAIAVIGINDATDKAELMRNLKLAISLRKRALGLFPYYYKGDDDYLVDAEIAMFEISYTIDSEKAVKEFLDAIAEYKKNIHLTQAVVNLESFMKKVLGEGHSSFVKNLRILTGARTICGEL
jgi:hypothetical protein